jgi:hypothetical protein
VALLQKLTEPEFVNAGLALSQKMWQSGSRLANPLYFSGIALVLFILIEVVGPKKGAVPKVTYCQMCGNPFAGKPRKKKGEEDAPDKLCTQCIYIFKKKTTVKVEKRNEKVIQIQNHQTVRNLVAKVSSFCVPGGGQIYVGYPLKGLLLASGFACGLALLVLKIYSPSLLIINSSARWPTFILLGCGGLLAVGTYVYSVIDILRVAPKNQ